MGAKEMERLSSLNRDSHCQWAWEGLVAENLFSGVRADGHPSRSLTNM